MCIDIYKYSLCAITSTDHVMLGGVWEECADETHEAEKPQPQYEAATSHDSKLENDEALIYPSFLFFPLFPD